METFLRIVVESGATAASPKCFLRSCRNVEHRSRQRQKELEDDARGCQWLPKAGTAILNYKITGFA